MQAKNDLVTVNGYPEDVKTLLAFDPAADSAGTGLAGFTAKVHPPGADPRYMDNNVRLVPSPQGGRS
jgi:hypothetical protein